MNNNELQKIKDKRKRFYMLRKEIIGLSCMEMKKEKERYDEIVSSDEACKYLIFNPYIRDRILEDLERGGYDINDKGTQYMATIALIFYHERKLFRRNDIEDNGYWDLDLDYNEHFSMLGRNINEVKREITKAIEKSDDYGICSMAEVIYDEADYYGYYGKDRDDKKRKSYYKTLVK